MGETLRLAEFAARLRFEDIPADVVEFAKVLLLDNLACGFVGAGQPWAAAVLEMANEWGGREECSIFAHRMRCTPSAAALVNGVMIGAFEAEHAAPIGAHPSGNVFPPVFAWAEKFRMSGQTMLVAMIAGYEVVCRIAEASTRAVEDQRGFHTPATNGQFGAAVGVGKLLALEADEIASAMGIAGSHSGGLAEFVWEGAMTKRLHLGRAGQMGLESAVLARKGFTGPKTILEGRKGYLQAFSPVFYAGKLVDGLGDDWRFKSETFIKPYTCHGTQQAVVQALLAEKAAIDTDKIESIVIRANHHMVHLHDDVAPTSIMGAQYSMPFVVAVALTSDITKPRVFSQQTLWNKRIRRLAARVRLIEDDRFALVYDAKGPHAEITMTTSECTKTITASGFRGMPSQPFTSSDIRQKFERFAEPYVSKVARTSLADSVLNVERIDDVSSFAPLIAGTA
jgi:2-methylcitrate dehydratase PrpD